MQLCDSLACHLIILPCLLRNREFLTRQTIFLSRKLDVLVQLSLHLTDRLLGVCPSRVNHYLVSLCT